MAKRLGFIEDELEKELQENASKSSDDFLGWGFHSFLWILKIDTKFENPTLSTKTTDERIAQTVD